LLRALDTGEHVDPNRITVHEWLKTWLRSSSRFISLRAIEFGSKFGSNRS